VGVALASTHTCRRVLGEVELEPLHLGDEVAAAPGGRGISVDRPKQRGWVERTDARFVIPRTRYEG
jgi:hypothetical protein